MLRILFSLLLLTLLFLTPQFAQQPNAAKPQDKPKEKKEAEEDQTIKLATELIEVRAVVTDKDGKLIEGLKQEDFELLENNKPQTVSFFDFTRIAGRSATPTTQPKTAEEITNKTAAPPARSVLLFADTLHMAAGNLLSLKQSLRGFLDKQLTDQDLAALVASYGSLGLGEQFTRDRRLLRYAAERLSVGPTERISAFTPYLAAQVERGDPQAMTEAIRILRQEEALDGPRSVLESIVHARATSVLSIASFRSRQTLLTLRAVVDNLTKMPGQRLLVLFSDGFTTLDNSGSPDMSELQNVISRAVRAGVIIYSIDAAGLRPPPMMGAEFGTLLDSRYASGGESEAQNGLNALAADTGGKFFRNTNDIMGAATQALIDNEAIYTLAYYPNEEGKPNNFRKLTVRVKGHTEYKIRTQKGYIPAALKKTKVEVATTPEQKVRQKMLEPLASTELGVYASASDFEVAGEAAQVTLQVFIDGKTVTLRPNNERQQFEVKITLMVFDSSGKLAMGVSEILQGNLRPERAELFQREGLRYLKRLSLKPGFYQLRIGMYEPTTERIGTASAIVQVPDLKRKQFMLSSVIITDKLEDTLSGATKSIPSNQADTPEMAARIVQGIAFYRQNQKFVYYFQLYSNAPQAAKPEELSLVTEIWNDDKLVASTPGTPLSERIIGRDEKGIIIGSQLLLKNFPPGLYELRLTVRGQSKKTVATRTVLFGVEE